MKCTCKFVRVGEPMANNDCPVHDRRAYACDRCDCPDYRPKREKSEGSTYWPVCVCGHVAQEHN